MAGDYDFKSTSFELKGFKRLYKALDRLPEAVKKKELEPILVKSLMSMRDLARAIAPNDPLTGPPWNLPTSIEVSVRQRSGRARSNRALGKYDARAFMGPTKFGYPQAIMTEFGTIHMVGTPYMRVAWDSQKRVALKYIADGLGDHLKMIIRKYTVEI